MWPSCWCHYGNWISFQVNISHCCRPKWVTTTKIYVHVASECFIYWLDLTLINISSHWAVLLELMWKLSLLIAQYELGWTCAAAFAWWGPVHLMSSPITAGRPWNLSAVGCIHFSWWIHLISFEKLQWVFVSIVPSLWQRVAVKTSNKNVWSMSPYFCPLWQIT